MRFGPVPPDDADGAVLAHSLTLDGVKLKKGRVLDAKDIAVLQSAGVAAVTVARLEPGDLSENQAAARLAAALAPDPAARGLTVADPFTGRVNLLAAASGVLRVDHAQIDAFNAIDPAITLATLPDWARVAEGQMIATCKIIPYAVAGDLVERAADTASSAAPLVLHPFRRGTASVILTRTPGMKQSLIDKGVEILRARLTGLGLDMLDPCVVPHKTDAVSAAVAGAGGDMILILGGSATSDIADSCPQGVVDAGGEIARFGMPVDPGNLLFIGTHYGRPVVGMPGCARSPALNGADWVLERLAAGLAVTAGDIAAMGVGGLLKEIPVRPQPRAQRSRRQVRGAARVAALVLAAGASRRMRGADKLLEPVDGEAVLRRVASAALVSRAVETLVIVPPDAEARRAALEGLDVGIVEARNCAEGMSASLRAGLGRVSGDCDAVVVLLADMPEVDAGAIDRLIAAFDPVAGHEIARAVSDEGRPGHPVLFGRRFFESLAGLGGDKGAREVVAGASGFVIDVPTGGDTALIDLDTPEDWAAWRLGAHA